VSTNLRLEAESKDLRSEVERLKGDLVKKDEDIERLRSSASEAQARLKEQTARQLLDTRLFLGKSDVAGIKDLEAYNNKLTEFTKRSIDSLTDALSDLAPEITNFKT